MISHQGVLTLGLTVVLLALPFLTSGETLHVRPTSTNTSCPTHPCHTLSEYAQDPGQYFNDSNLTLLFLPGNHTVDVNVTITNIHRLEILGNTSAVVPTMVVCSSNVGFTFEDIWLSKINGLAFVLCSRSRMIQADNKHLPVYYGLYLKSIQMVEIISCTFRNSAGSALGVVKSHVILRGNNFLNNNNNIDCWICSHGRCYWSSTCFGGGIFAVRSNITFTGSSSFIGNSADGGGGIYAATSTNVNISGNMTFLNNSASDYGGGLYAWPSCNVIINANTKFIGNSAGIDGGGVYARFNNNVNISVIFIGNSAVMDGGGVYAVSHSNLSFSENTKFIGNSAGRDGGGVYAESDSNLYISGTFTDNSAGDGGGGVYVESNSHIVISGNTNFIHNSVSGTDVGEFSSESDGHGGGIFIGQNSKAYISGNITIIGNSANYGGGVCLDDYSILNICGSTTFISNLAVDGGGVYIRHTNNVNISKNTTFYNNSAYRRGGGVCAWYGNILNISGVTTFTANSAHDGGGVYSWSNNDVNINGNITFIGNNASNGGGGVCSWPHSKFSVESICNIHVSGNTIFINNAASRGGGIFAVANSSVDIRGNTTFIYNSARRHGGGIYAKLDCNGNISGSTIFIGNKASGSGGGVYSESNSNVSISGNTTFSGNSAERDGGGICARSYSSLRISGNTMFKSNLAVNGGGVFVNTYLNLEGNSAFINCSAIVGGAIYSKENQVNFSGANVFRLNRAEHFGGGLYAPKASLSLPGDNNFTANWAGFRGGGIFAQKAKIIFNGTGMLSGNVAQLDGGGIYIDGSSLTFNGNITIRNNTAQLGGGVYSDNNTFTIDGHNTVEKNVATHYGGGIYIRRSPLIVAGNNMFTANSAGEGGGIYATASSTLKLNGMNTFIGNKAHISGGGIWLDNSNLTLDGSNYFVKCFSSYEGGAIFTYASTTSLSGNNTFESNSATTGGGIHARWSNVSIKNSCSFKQNIAVFGGGIFTDNSAVELSGSSALEQNFAKHTGGGIYAARSVLVFLGRNFITANHATRDGGGIYTRDDCVVNLLGLNNYQNNSAGDTGGGISAFQSSFNLVGQNMFNFNKAVVGGGLYTFNCTVNFSGENTFTDNSASNRGGGFAEVQSTLHLIGSTIFEKNSAVSGGGMFIGDSTVDSGGSNCFMSNKAYTEGGGIDARNSLVEFNGRDIFGANSARSRGAAIHSSFTTLIFQGGSSFVNNSAEYGGGVHIESSNFTVAHHRFSHHALVSPPCINCGLVCNDLSTISDIKFLNNTALRGGAQYFDLYSNFSLFQTAHVYFQDNHATEFGGAIYVADVLGPSQFLSQQHLPFRSECFFHMFRKVQSFELHTAPLVFVNNSAGIRGSVLYGGLLDKCNMSSDRNTSTLELFNMSTLQIQDKNDTGYSISSDPTQLCFCNMTGRSCSDITTLRTIYPGQQVAVSVVAIDQSGSAIPTLIHANVRLGHNLTLSETISYETGSNCTGRNYSVTPKSFFNLLELQPSNRSGNTIDLTVNITFESCPIGFEQSNSSGECICDHRIWQYTNSCDIDRKAVLRNATRAFWLSVSYNNGSVEGFIHHRYCPLDYCISGSKYIDLSNPETQCNHNRSGILCGRCMEGLSLVLGSSQCKQCSNNYLALLVPFALAGVLLVILLFLLHLTVAAGTLHGLIFYANIVAANHHIFFPHTSNNPASIFIAWLNLDLGIQTCFYNGMDAYAKTWLEFVFPVYIWMIVGFLVYISDHSVTVTKLLGSSPVPVLATLFLLSYAKLLRTVIAALSLTILHYPYKSVVVWMHDANISFARYIPLVLVALLFLILLFLPYTLLLLLGQWLQPKSHLCLLTWMRSPKVRAILDTYHAPYKTKHRYWTGLLLFLRCALFLVFAFNISGDESVNLLVISSGTFGIFVGFVLLGKVYKNLYLNALEVSFILNLGMLAVATYHVNQSGGSQSAVAYTSVGIAFLTFLGIVIYHIYIQIKSKVAYIQRGNQLQRGKKCHINNNNDNPGNLDHQPRAIPTVTEVNLHELRSPLDLLSYHQMN